MGFRCRAERVWDLWLIELTVYVNLGFAGFRVYRVYGFRVFWVYGLSQMSLSMSSYSIERYTKSTYFPDNGCVSRHALAKKMNPNPKSLHEPYTPKPQSLEPNKNTRVIL